MNLKTTTKWLLVGTFALALAQSSRAQIHSEASILGYDNLSTGATAGFSDYNTNNPVYGDSLTLAQSGVLDTLSLSLFNSTSGGNTGSILTGNMVVKFYDNTTAYAGGPITGTLLGSATLLWDFTSGGGLPAGYYSTSTFDLSALNISLGQNILITQSFTESTGTSTRNGIVLFNNATTGSSPNTIYLKSGIYAEGLYTLTGNPGQIGYTITLVPEPTSVALAGLAAAALLIFRRRK